MLRRFDLDLDHLTVIYTDTHGERYDLNATGEPCRNRADLRAFVVTLARQRVIDEETRAALLVDVDG